MKDGDDGEHFFGFFEDASEKFGELFDRWRWFAIRLIVFEILFFLFVGILAHHCYFTIASLIVAASTIIAAFFVFQPKVMSLLLLIDIGNYLSGKPLTPNSSHPLPIVRAYAKTMVLALAMHTATLVRLVAISPLIVADNQTTAAATATGILFFLYRVREAGWEKAVARFVLWASITAMVAGVAQTLPFVASHVETVCASR